ncbi:Elongator subunit elp4 [Mactra antiquata]
MTTSFQKKTRSKVLQIPGAKPSIYNNQLLISTGIPSLDHILGGGVAVGTILLIEEDTYGNYARLMLKYFCAEAVMTGHSLLLASADADPEQILKELPAPIIDDPGKGEATLEEPSHDSSSDNMKIAWRYRHLPKFQSNTSGVKFGHYYDLSKTMESELTQTVDISTVDSSLCACDSKQTDGEFNNPGYNSLLKTIQEKIMANGFSTTTQVEKRNILRLALHSIGSPMWGEKGGLTENEMYSPALPRFLVGLKAILRTAYACCVITVPAHLFCDKAYVRRLERLTDTVVEVDSFVGSDKEKNPVYKDYHGLFNIKQLPCLNSLVCNMPDSLDLAFKLRRKKLTIEKLHLPPDLSETANRSQEDPLKNLKPSSGCGTGGRSNKLEF